MVKSVLFTYDIDKARMHIYQGKVKGNVLAGEFYQDLLHDLLLQEMLRKNGVHVDFIDPYDYIDTRAKVRDAELIWYRPTLSLAGLEGFLEGDVFIMDAEIERIFAIIEEEGRIGKTQGLTELLDPRDKKATTDYLESKGIPIVPAYSVKDFKQRYRWFQMICGQEELLPAVLRKNDSSQGQEVFLVEDMKVMQKFFSPQFYERAVWADPTLEHVFQDSISSFMVIDNEQQKRGYNFPREQDYIVSPFIETPSDYLTHFRILTFHGEVLGAVLQYAPQKDHFEPPYDYKDFKLPVNLSQATKLPDTSFDLFWKPIHSNLSNGAAQIPLGNGPYTRRINRHEKEILKAHGIDPNNPVLPEHLQTYSRLVSMGLSRKGIQYGGIDAFLGTDLKPLFIEFNDNPSLDPYRQFYATEPYKSKTMVELEKMVLASAIKAM